MRELTGDQRRMLRALFESYAEDMPEDVSRAWLGEIRRAGFEAVRFAWAGPGDRSQPHAYRVQGPTFLIEFNNTQNGANHIHSVWRNMLGDFGIPHGRALNPVLRAERGERDRSTGRGRIDPPDALDPSRVPGRIGSGRRHSRGTPAYRARPRPRTAPGAGQTGAGPRGGQ